MSFTAFNQSNDSTICFSLDQVKAFLRTKVELVNALESNDILLARIEQSETIQIEQLLNIEKKAKKLKRTRAIAGAGGGLAVIFGLLLFIK